MKTSIIKEGVAFTINDAEMLFNKSLSVDDFFVKYLFENPHVNNIISNLLAKLNNSDGGGPVVTLRELSAIDNNLRSGKIKISYQLNLEWGCEGIKKQYLRSEKFDFELDMKNHIFYLYLFLTA